MHLITRVHGAHRLNWLVLSNKQLIQSISLLTLRCISDKTFSLPQLLCISALVLAALDVKWTFRGLRYDGSTLSNAMNFQRVDGLIQ